MSRLKLSLLDNAVSFAKDALSNAIAAEEHPLRWKFAILSMVQSIELSLKELLKNQHPFLIYTNVDKPGNTVGIEQAKNRLKQIAGVDLTKDERDALKTAAAIRNKIVHHEVDEAVAEMRLVFARLLGFLNDFHRAHLGDPIQDSIDEDLWSAGATIQAHGDEWYKRALERLKADGVDDSDCLTTCTRCGWEALPAFGDHSETCYVCGHVEHLAVCDRCEKIMLFGDHEESGDKIYCWDCLCYVTDDYWYEQSVGK